MDTTAAAAQAGVTVDTIRTWCRMGAVKAAKAAGKWTIAASSLAYRISLGIRKAAKKAKEVVIDFANMVAIGGSAWERYGKRRVYFNDAAAEKLAGLDITYYKSGNVRFAALDGESISNTRARGYLYDLGKVFYDDATGRIHGGGTRNAAINANARDLVAAL